MTTPLTCEVYFEDRPIGDFVYAGPTPTVELRSDRSLMVLIKTGEVHALKVCKRRLTVPSIKFTRDTRFSEEAAEAPAYASRSYNPSANAMIFEWEAIIVDEDTIDVIFDHEGFEPTMNGPAESENIADIEDIDVVGRYEPHVITADAIRAGAITTDKIMTTWSPGASVVRPEHAVRISGVTC